MKDRTLRTEPVTVGKARGTDKWFSARRLNGQEEEKSVFTYKYQITVEPLKGQRENHLKHYSHNHRTFRKEQEMMRQPQKKKNQYFEFCAFKIILLIILKMTAFWKESRIKGELLWPYHFGLSVFAIYNRYNFLLFLISMLIYISCS